MSGPSAEYNAFCDFCEFSVNSLNGMALLKEVNYCIST